MYIGRLLGVRASQSLRLSVHASRHVVSSQQQTRTKATGTPDASATTEWFYQYCWGFSSIPDIDNDDVRNDVMRGYAQTLCYVIAADGKGSDAEIKWVKGYLASKGYGSISNETEATVKRAESMTLEEMVADTEKAISAGSLKFAGKAIIYDSLRAAQADGLDDKELAAINAMAGVLGVSTDFVNHAWELAMEEDAFRAKKARIITPGHPNLDAKYQ